MTEPETATDEAVIADLAMNRVDEEDIRLVTGFGDIFAAVGLAGLFFAIFALGAGAVGALAGIAVSAAAWFLSGPMVVSRKFAASGVVLSLAFGIGILVTSASVVEVLAPLPAAGGLWIYWRRFRVPISAALILAALVGTGVLITSSVVSAIIGISDDRLIPYLAVIGGLVLFALAMHWDMGDRERVTRRSSVAFWLHLCAGPLIAHGTFSLLGFSRFGMGLGGYGHTPMVWPVFVLFGIFTIIALVVDRRPLLLSSFAYLVYAIGTVVFKSTTGEMQGGENILLALIITLASTGLLVVVLAAAWSPLRGFLLKYLPPAITERVPAVSHWSAPNENIPVGKGESEPLRLVLGLNDYLASIGLGTLFFGAVFAGYLIALKTLLAMEGAANFDARYLQVFAGWRPWLALGVPMAMILLMTEFFVRRRRMALTAIIAAHQFALLTILGMALAFYQSNTDVFGAVAGYVAKNTELAALSLPASIMICIGGALCNLAFWRFNKVPISFALACMMLFPLFFLDIQTGYHVAGQDGLRFFSEVFRSRALIFGLLLFGGAVAWDMSDRARLTSRADNAFWLHMFASLLVVPALFEMTSEWRPAILVAFGLYAILLLIALVTDRRAPLVVVIPYMLKQSYSPSWYGDGPLLPIVIFGLMVALVIFWEKLRRIIGNILPISRLAIR
jgi:hypothetical protein